MATWRLIVVRSRRVRSARGEGDGSEYPAEDGARNDHRGDGDQDASWVDGHHSQHGGSAPSTWEALADGIADESGHEEEDERQPAENRSVGWRIGGRHEMSDGPERL